MDQNHIELSKFNNGKSESPRADKVFRHVVGLIFDGKLLPGARLPSERDLADQLRVSRTTLRDALNQLRARGYIESRSKSGNYVRTAIPQSLSAPIEDVVQAKQVGLDKVVEIRKVLELWAVETAAVSRDHGQLRDLEDCVLMMSKNLNMSNEKEFIRHRDADLRFHQVLATMTGNPVYVHLIHFLTHLIARSIDTNFSGEPQSYAVKNLEAHQAILQAIEQQDPDKARKAMLAHFDFPLVTSQK